MEQYLWWAVAGVALIIAELVTGTFYLLVIGVAAFAGAAAAFYHQSFWVQAVLAAAVATVGVILVSRYRAMQAALPNVALDVGQSVVFESWISEQDRMARVRYRNAAWDAKLIDGQGVAAGQVLHIRNVEGSTLHVSTARQA